MFLRRPDSRRLTLRLIVWHSGIFILGAAFLFALAYMLLSSSVRRQDREDIRQELSEYAAQYRAGGIEALRQEVALEEHARVGTSFFVRVSGPGNETLFVSIPEQWRVAGNGQFQSTAANGKVQQVRLQMPDGDKMLEVEAISLADGKVLQVGKSTEDRERLLERFREIFLLFTIPVVILGILGGALLASRALRPVRNLIRTVRTVSAGEMSARVPASQTGDELDELVVLFNSMLEKIETLICGMRGALDNAAHDLRTPLTRLRGAAEMGLRSGQSPESCREALADCVEESERILTMLNTLMDISEAETGAMRLHLEAVSLPSLIEDAVELYRDVAEEKEIELHVSVPPDLSLVADCSRMRQVLANLLDNAIKYTPRGGRVSLAAFAQGPQAVITIEDTGAGIEPGETAKIWERLYRSDKSRSQRGLGLGLSLVKAIVQAYDGSVEVASTPGAGSSFTLRLPAVSAQVC